MACHDVLAKRCLQFFPGKNRGKIVFNAKIGIFAPKKVAKMKTRFREKIRVTKKMPLVKKFHETLYIAPKSPGETM